MRKLENAVGCWLLAVSPAAVLPARHGTSTTSATPDSCRGANPSWPRSHIRRDTSNHRSATDFLSLCPRAPTCQSRHVTCHLPSLCLSYCSPPIAGQCPPPMFEAVLDLLVHNLRQSTLKGSALALHRGPRYRWSCPLALIRWLSRLG